MESFVAILANSPLNLAVNSQGWIVPATQAIHIGALAICAFAAVLWVVSSANMLGPKLSAPLYELLPRFFWPTAVLVLLSGITLVISEPARELLAISFWLKMALVIAVFATLRFWQVRKTVLRQSHIYAVAATFIAVIFLGRMIAIDSALWTING